MLTSSWAAVKERLAPEYKLYLPLITKEQSRYARAATKNLPKTRRLREVCC